MNIPEKTLLVTAAALGLIGETSFLPRKYQDRTHCADCGADVGPGRPGRRCEPCRNPPPPQRFEFVT